MEKNNSVFIKHILDSINAVENFSKDISKQEFGGNRLVQSAVVREIEIIGEAVKNLSEEFKNKNKEIPWKEIIGTRDKMIHHYFGIDLEIVWEIIKFGLPELKTQMLEIKKNIIKKD